MPALLIYYLLLIAVVVELSGASQRDLIMGKRPALRHRKCLGARIRLRFRSRLYGFEDIDRLRAADWSDHNRVPKG